MTLVSPTLTFPICSTALSRGSDGCSGETKKGYFLSLSTGSCWQCGNDPPESFGLLAAGRESNRSVTGVD